MFSNFMFIICPFNMSDCFINLYFSFCFLVHEAKLNTNEKCLVNYNKPASDNLAHTDMLLNQ